MSDELLILLTFVVIAAGATYFMAGYGHGEDDHDDF
jgi:hypothetical protein